MQTSTSEAVLTQEAYWACKRKKKYDLKKEARLALLQCWKRGRAERSLYPCSHCGGFHLTKKEPESGERET